MNGRTVHGVAITGAVGERFTYNAECTRKTASRIEDCLCGLVVRVPGYRSRRYQIFFFF
jgi:hypothetical protein